jgi:predicted amidohydrolase YtcJ
MRIPLRNETLVPLVFQRPSGAMSLFISNVEVNNVKCSVLVDNATVVEVGTNLVRPRGSDQIEGNGGMLLPGLHDHHVHLLSSAASARSLTVGPPAVGSIGDLRRVLRDAARTRGGDWIRATGYHESVAGPLNRHVLDQVVSTSPLRIQHRTGAMWFLNSLGLNRSGLDASGDPAVERDDLGRPTGRLWRGDHLFGIGEGVSVDDLRALSDAAASHGVTGFTDATPSQNRAGIETLGSARQAGAIRQRLTLMSPLDLDASTHSDVKVGPVKVLLDDVDLPALDDLVEVIVGAHRVGRPVAIHCVTDVQTALALTAINAAAPNGKDRIEHGSIMPFEFDTLAKVCKVTVVTQPHFIAERGDDYLRHVPKHLHEVLYRARTLVNACIPLASGTDAPFGSGDPWIAIAAATQRATGSGIVINPQERLTPMQAVNLFTGDARAPGRQRRIEVGAHADFCLLSLDTTSALEDLSTNNVRATIIDGLVVFER